MLRIDTNTFNAEDLMNIVEDPDMYEQIDEQFLADITKIAIDVLPEEFPGEYPAHNTAVVNAYFTALAFYIDGPGIQVTECITHNNITRICSYSAIDAEENEYVISFAVRDNRIKIVISYGMIMVAEFNMEKLENGIDYSYFIDADNTPYTMLSLTQVMATILEDYVGPQNHKAD